MMNGKNSFFDMDVGKTFAGFNLPGLDAESVMATQRKNLEAFTQANQLAVEGVQAVTRRQVEIAREAFEGASAALREFTLPSMPNWPSRCSRRASPMRASSPNSSPRRIARRS